jgi:hypothetical protein
VDDNCAVARELQRTSWKGDLRVSDDERERTVRALRHHYSVGRITSAELEQRIGRAYAARQRSDLASLLADLPSDRGVRIASGLSRADRIALRAHAASFGAVNGGLVAIWAATGGGDFWPGWAMAGWAPFVALHWVTSRTIRSAFRGRSRSGRRPATPR